jgi:peptidyl-prolyl cis-trans isomerase D
MAIIGTIRKHSALAVILVGVAIGAFILSDLFTGPGKQSIPPMGVIAGEEISASDYNRKVDENIKTQQINLGKEALTAEESFEVRVSTWDQYLNEIILGKEYEKIGLTVTTEELYDLVQGPRPHRLITQYFTNPETGLYDPEVVRNFLLNLNSVDPEVKKQWIALEQFIKEDRLSQKYTQLVSKGYYLPDALARQEMVNKKKAASVRFAAVRYSSIPDADVVLTDEDYEAYYEENKGKFKQDDARDIDYILFEVLPSAEDRAQTREEVYRIFQDFQSAPDPIAYVNSVSDNRYDSAWFAKGKLPVNIDALLFDAPVGTFVPPYEENNAWHMARLMADATRPDSMKAEHILISYQGAFRAAETVTRTKEAAERRADSLLRQLQIDRDRMPDLAFAFSDDPSARSNKGDLGWFADGSMVHAFNEAVLNAKIGDLVKVETVFGFHVIKVTGKKDPVKKIRVAIIDRAIEPSSKTFQDKYTEASIFAGENSTKEKFDKSVEDKGLNKRTATYLREMANKIAGVDYAREIIRWAFTEGIEVGDVSPVFDVDGAYVVAILTVKREKGFIPLDQLKENVKTQVINEKKAQQIIDKMKNSGPDVYQVAQAFNIKVDTNTNLTFSSRNIPGFGSEYQVIGKIFSMNEGEYSGPVKGNGAVFVVQVDRFAEPAESDYSVYRQQAEGSFKSRVNSSNILMALQEKAKITDNRGLYF